jgi:hypothetical protein
MINPDNDMIIFKILDKNDQTLEVFVQKESYILLAIEPSGNVDGYAYQAVLLNQEDAKGLINQLQTFIDNDSITENP